MEDHIPPTPARKLTSNLLSLDEIMSNLECAHLQLSFPLKGLSWNHEPSDVKQKRLKQANNQPLLLLVQENLPTNEHRVTPWYVYLWSEMVTQTWNWWNPVASSTFFTSGIIFHSGQVGLVQCQNPAQGISFLLQRSSFSHTRFAFCFLAPQVQCHPGAHQCPQG